MTHQQYIHTLKALRDIVQTNGLTYYRQFSHKNRQSFRTKFWGVYNKVPSERVKTALRRVKGVTHVEFWKHNLPSCPSLVIHFK